MYIFKSRQCPPQHKELLDFENNLLVLVKNITFRKVHNKFHDQLKKGIKSIAKQRKLNKLLTENMSKICKNTTNKIYSNIYKEAKLIAHNYETARRIDSLLKTDTFIAIKNCKPNFTTNRKFRLINLSNSELEKVSKNLIKKISTIIRNKSLINLLRDTGAVIN